jgi:hypothetical protein
MKTFGFHKKGRKKSVIQTLLSTIKRIVSNAPTLIEIFEQLKGMFGSV